MVTVPPPPLVVQPNSAALFASNANSIQLRLDEDPIGVSFDILNPRAANHFTVITIYQSLLRSFTI
jgi:hypothetical protein